jgi:antitoxin component YwqK of YwqJK toxin-antitoxin module
MNSLEVLKKYCAKYVDDEQYVYKKCYDCTILDKSRRWLVVMRKTKETKTNEKRTENNYFPQNAKHRASILKVIEIIDVDDPLHTKRRITNVYHDDAHQIVLKRTTYRVGECVRPDQYDQNIDNICSGGIHYFKSIERAFAYDTIPESFCGQISNYRDDGVRLNTYSYTNGVLNGPAIVWHESNKEGDESICAKFGHLDGMRHGRFVCLYSDGKQEVKGNYQNGYRCGKWIYLYPNGGKKACGTFVGGDLNDYDPTESILYEQVKGGRWTYWHPNGNKSSEGEYVNGHECGLWTTWYDDGVKSSEGSYFEQKYKFDCRTNDNGERGEDSGVRSGRWTFWHPNGNKSIEGEYVDGYKYGSWTTWYDNGVKSSEGTYSKTSYHVFTQETSILNGLWIHWYNCGQKLEEGEYVDGRKLGKHLKWHQNGRLASKVFYFAGVMMDGTEQRWDVDGKKISTKRKRTNS